MKRAFTLTELLVVIAVIGILAALLLPALSASKARARRTVCLSNLAQIDSAIRMYSDDSGDALPAGGTNGLILYSGYKALMKNYLGLKGASSPQDKIFSCPADVFFPSFIRPNDPTPSPAYNVPQSLHDQSFLDYSSYAFNGGDNVTRTIGRSTDRFTWLGLKGRTLSSIKNPSRTVLVSEASAHVPWSWHNALRKELQYTDARNVVGFVDGHVDYINIYWNSNRFPSGAFSAADNYNPPAGYDYQWSGD